MHRVTGCPATRCSGQLPAAQPCRLLRRTPVLVTAPRINGRPQRQRGDMQQDGRRARRRAAGAAAAAAHRAPRLRAPGTGPRLGTVRAAWLLRGVGLRVRRRGIGWPLRNLAAACSDICSAAPLCSSPVAGRDCSCPRGTRSRASCRGDSPLADATSLLQEARTAQIGSLQPVCRCVWCEWAPRACPAQRGHAGRGVSRPQHGSKSRPQAMHGLTQALLGWARRSPDSRQQNCGAAHSRGRQLPADHWARGRAAAAVQA